MRDESNTRYVSGIPRKLAKGRVLVHNQVIPHAVLGWNGFRAWTQLLTTELEVCRCNWAGVDLRGLVHYRVKTHRKMKKDQHHAA